MTMIERPWTHGSRLGREHASVRMHLVEDHGTQPGWAENASDGAVHGKHDGLHGETWAYASDLPHGAPLICRPCTEGRHGSCERYRDMPGPAWCACPDHEPEGTEQ